MQNYGKAQEYMGIATNSSGESLKKYEAYQDSIAGKIEKTKASLQDLSTTAINSDFAKGLIDAGSGLMDMLTNLIDKFGVLTPVMASFMTKGFRAIRYDSENGFSSDLSMLKKAKKKPFKIASQDNDILSKINKSIKVESQTAGLVDWDGFIAKHGNASSSLKGFLKDTNYSVKSLDNYKAYVEKTTNATSGFAKALGGLKSVGATALSFAGNMLIMAAVSKGIEFAAKAIDDYIHKSENMIKKGKEASDSIKETFDSFSDSQKSIMNLGKSFSDSEENIVDTGDAIDSIAEKYTKLSSGVNKFTNENKSLSAEGYKEYLDVCNQLSEQFPTLVTGYDSQGNAILNLGNNAIEASVKLRELYNSQMLTANADIGKNLNDSIKGYLEQIKVYEAKSDEAQDKINKNKKAIKEFQNSIRADKISGSNLIEYDRHALGESASGFDKEIRSILQKHGIAVNEYEDQNTHKIKYVTDKVINDKVAKEIHAKAELIYNNALKNISLDNNELARQSATNESLVKQQWDLMADSIGAYLNTSSSFTNLNKELQGALLGNLTKLDTSTLNSDYKGDVAKFLHGEFITPLSQLTPDVQKEVANLFNVTDVSISEFSRMVDNTLGNAFGEDKELVNSFKQKLGLNEIIDDSREKLSTLTSVYGSALSNLSLDEIDKVHELAVEGNFELTFDELMDRYEQARAEFATGIDLKINTNLDAIKTADDTANAGDDYVKAVKYADEIKKMYESGLVGTDDFKTRAAYFSPTGATDPVNFKENEARITRYMTEDRSGVANFLKDLEKKGYASLEKAADGTAQWSYNMDDLEQSAKDMGMSLEWMLDMFGRLEDYGFSNNFVGNVDDGVARIADLTTKVTTARAELAHLKASNADSTAIEQKEAEIAKLESDIKQTDQALEVLKTKASEKYVKQVSEAKTTIQLLGEEIKKYTSDPSILGDNTDEVVSKMRDEIQRIADENDITLDANLNIVEEGNIRDKINGVYSLDVDYSSLDEVKQRVVESKEKIDELFSHVNNAKLNVDTTSVKDLEKQIFASKHALKEFINEDGTINLNADGAEELLSTLNVLYARKMELTGEWIMHLPVENISGELGAILGKLQEFQSAYTELQQLQTLQEAGVKVDTESAKAKIDSLTQDIQSLVGENRTVFIDLGFKEGALKKLTPESISNAIGNINKDALIKANVDESTIQATQNKINGVKGKDVSLTVQDAAARRTIFSFTSLLSTIPSYKSTTLAVTEKKTVKTTYETDWASPKIPYANGLHGLNGTAHAKGTWGAKRSGRTLVGEIAPEILVDPASGRFETIGNNGAEFINLKKGQIIFNHKQSEELLKNGYVSSNHGRGKIVGGALAGGTGYGGFYGSGVAYDPDNKNKKRKSGGSSKSSSSGKDKASESVIDFVEIAIKRITEGINRIKILAESTFDTFAKRNDAIAHEIRLVAQKIDLSQKAYDTYIAEANSVGLSENYASQIRDGSLNIETITDEDLSKKIKDYQEWWDKAESVRTSIMELNEEISKLHKQSFDNIGEEYDGILKVIGHYKDMIDESIKQSEEKGFITSVKYYEALKEREYENITQLEREKSALLNNMNNAVANGSVEKYSKTWYDMCGEINKVTQSIEEANTAVLKYNNSIREIEWEIFDKTQEKISGIIDESEFLAKLMKNEKLYEDNGQLTNFGMSTMGLHGVNYNVYVAQAQKYKEEMLKVEKELATNPYDQKLIKRKNELLELQQEMILGAEDEKQAIKDMVSEGIELELKALDKLINKFNEAIDAQKDLHDYQNRIDEQTKEIGTLEKQLNAYAGDTSEESQSKIQQIKVSLEEARKNLDETNYEKYISDQKVLLDELYTEYETVLNERLDNLDALISDMVAEINNNASIINTTLSDKADSVGYTISENMKNIWDTSSSSINSVISSNGVNIVNAVTTVNTTLTAINTNVSSMISQLNKLASTKVQSVNASGATTTPQASGGGSGSSGGSSSSSSGSSSSSSGSSSGGWGSWFIRKKDRYPKSRLQINSSIVDRLKYFDFDSSTSARQKYFYAMGGSGRYIGTDAQNLWMIKQMKAHGYKNGVFNLKRDEFAWTQEGGKEELFIRPDGGVATLMQEGTSVLNANATKNLYDFVNNPAKFVDGLNGANINSTIKNGNGNNYYNYDIDIPIDHVDDFNDLVDKMKSSKRFENVVTSMTTGRLSGGSRMDKYRH